MNVLGSVSQMRKASIGFIISECHFLFVRPSAFCLSVRMVQLVSRYKYCIESLYLSIFLKYF